MVCSPEQLASNRKNSQKSTGPKTAEGKERSRRNGLKHGLTGAGVVIADEDVAEVQGRFEAFEVDLKPANQVARFLSRRVAFLSVRLDRSAREEAAKITLDMHEAKHFEEDARIEELGRLLSILLENPMEAVRKLRRSAEGIDWLLESWQRLRVSLQEPDAARWSPEFAQCLTGRKAGFGKDNRLVVLSLALKGSFERLEPTDWPNLSPAQRQEAARAALLEFVEREAADLKAAYAALDHETIAKVRAGAATRAIFNKSKEAALARRYEAANERAFYKALKQVEEINAAAEAAEEEQTEVEETVEEETTCDELGSSFPGYLGDSRITGTSEGWIDLQGNLVEMGAVEGRFAAQNLTNSSFRPGSK